MTASNPSALEGLLAQAGWAKSLARQLARDDDSADELVQRTWIAALEHPPVFETGGAPARLRRWMASVMRNFARQDARERERRLQRESAAARPERAPEGADDGIEAQRKLLDLLQSLAEPYRGTLYARYFDGLSPREIARRDALALKTVKTRLARGLALLRERLDRSHGGDRAAWMAWIVPMAAKSALPTAFFGALIVDSKLKLAGALFVAICLLATGVQLLRPEAVLPGAPTVPAVLATIPEQPPEVSGSVELSNSGERISVGNPTPPAQCPVPHGTETLHPPVRGRVLDLDNRPVAGVHIAYEARHRPAPWREPLTPPDLRTDAGGNFELPAGPRDVNALVDDVRWVTVYKAYIAPDSEREATIFVAPVLELAGVVVDPDHHPLENAEVELRLSDSIKRKLDRRLDGAYRQNFIAKTDANGRFQLARMPACEAELHASAPGWSAATIPAPALDASDLEIVLAARDQRPALVRGIVLDDAGKPIEGAHVGVGGMTMLSAADGRFTFDLDSQTYGELMTKGSDGVLRPKYTRDHLRAIKYGRLPCEVALPPIDELRADATPREFKLVLEGATLEIHGHVVDADGVPIPSANLRILDETPFGPIYDRVGEAAVGWEISIEELLRGGQGFMIADAARDGRFEIRGLTARRYDLAALDPKTMRYGVLRGVVAGTSDARIELPGSAQLAHVAGRVVSRSGRGLGGISLQIGRLADDSMVPDWANSLQTDSNGRFDLGSIVADRLRIQVLGEEIFLIMAWEAPPDAQLDALEIKVSLRCPVKVELTPTAVRADEFSFLDGAGTATTNLQFQGPMMSLPDRCAIVDGISEAFATEDTATTLVLYVKGQEVARQPVRLTPGVLNTLRP